MPWVLETRLEAQSENLQNQGEEVFIPTQEASDSISLDVINSRVIRTRVKHNCFILYLVKESQLSIKVQTSKTNNENFKSNC